MSSPFSPQMDRAMEALKQLDYENRRAGADVRAEAFQIVKGIPLLEMSLEQSDDLSNELPGAARLRRRRRLGILRNTEGWRRGLPFFEPLVFASTSSPEWRIRALWDELELMVLYGRREDRRWRPSRDELTFDEVRALLEMRAGTLYRLTSKEQIPGLIRRHLRDGSGSYTAELRFSTVELMSWSKVLVPEYRAGTKT
jgi:hypothetical protein